jgi:hypothetical protein
MKTSSAHDPLHISYEDLKFERVPDAYALTWRLPDDSAALRLQSPHIRWVDPQELVAEVKLRHDEEFQPLRKFTLSPIYEMAHPEEFDNVWDELPDQWTEEFKAMLRIWGNVNDVLELLFPRGKWASRVRR